MNYKLCFLSAILLLLFNSCETQTQEKEISLTELQAEQLINEIDVHDLEIIVIDKCEYIFYKKSPSTNRGYGFMAHKGNCKNVIHYSDRNNEDHQ